MAYSELTYSADGGVKDFAVTFDYLDASHVYVSVDNVVTTEPGSNYTAELIGSTTMRVTTVVDGDPPPAGAKVRIFRKTPIEQPAVVFGAGASLSSDNLNKNSEYTTFALQEAVDTYINFTTKYLGAFDSAPSSDNDGNALIVGASYWDTTDSMLKFWNGAIWQNGNTLAESVAARDAAQTAASNASASETNASNSASAASTSESNAATSASNASISENNAASSEAKAEDWSETAEDVEVETGKYSSKHYSLKAEQYAEEAYNATSSGTVKSIDVAGGVGLTSSGGPITTEGTITVDLSTAAQASLSNADTAYGWGDHALAGYLTSVGWTDVTGKPSFGTASEYDVAATGDAALSEVVKGDDTRLSDARTPTAHTHIISDITDFEYATWQEATDGTNNTKVMTPLRVQQSINNTIRAWANFYGTNTVGIRNSFNVSSITDNGVGQYRVNFSNPMTTPDFVFTGTCMRADAYVDAVVNYDNYGTISDSWIDIGLHDTSGNRLDAEIVSLIIVE